MVTSSTSTSRQPLTLTGLASGLNTAQMINTLIEDQKGPIKILQGRAALRKQEATALGEVRSRLSTLLDSVKKFADASYTGGRQTSVTAGGTDATVSVSAGTSAAAGSFKVRVVTLADSTRVTSPGAISNAVNPAALLKDTNLGTAVTAGSFTVNGVRITVDPAIDSLNSIMQRIQDNVPGVTASLVNDADGRPNRLQLSGASVALGSATDDSNFLTATNLIASPGTATRTSTAGLGVTKTGATLSTLALRTPTTAASGGFKINGVQIDWDGSRDSLSTVLTRINNSAAGVTATYDSATDRVTMVSRATGSVPMTFEDTAGGLLDSLGVKSATQTLGKNAQAAVDTGAGEVNYYSTTNTLTDAVQGVTINLLKTGTAADTVAVRQDVDGAVGRVKELVTSINSAVEYIRTTTAVGKNGAGGGSLEGNFSIRQISDALRRLVTSPADGVTSGKTTLSSIGITYGAVGSSVGTTNVLQVDDDKLRAALQNDPGGVATLFAGFRATASLNTGGTGSTGSLSGDPNAVTKPGSYSLTTMLNDNGTAKVTAVFTPSDGDSPLTTTIDNVAAGSSHTDLIPGVTVQFKATLTAGTDTIAVNTPTRGVAAKLTHFLDPLARGGGVISQRQDTVNAGVKSINDQIQKLNDRLDGERTRLQTKFAAMEQAISRLQSQKSAVSQLASMVG